MKKIILLELCLLFLATTFQSDNPPGWYELTLPKDSITVQDIYFIDSLNGWVTSRKNTLDSSFIYFTSNGGINWTTQFGGNVYITTFDFPNENTGYAGGGDGFPKLYKTTDMGENWLSHNPIPAHLIRDLFFINSDTGWGCDSDPLFGGLWKTTNGGNTWIQQLGTSIRPSKIFFINADTGWAISPNSLSRLLYRTTDGGTNWSLQYTFSSGITDIYFLNSFIGLASSGLNYKTADGGFTWTTSNDGGRNITMGTDSVGWAGRVFNRIVKTTDQGNTWYQQVTPTFNNSTPFAFDSLIAWGGGSGIIKTTDGGGPILNIQQISSQIPEGFILHQNYPNPFNSNTKINYELQIASFVTLKVFNITGKEIAELINAKQSAGTYQYTFEATGLSSGVYFYRLEAETEKGERYVETRKMILSK